MLQLAFFVFWLFLAVVRAEDLDPDSTFTLGNESETAESYQAPSNLWQPKVGERWQIILNSTILLHVPLEPQNVKIWEIDLFDTPKTTIDALHDVGVKVICYFSGGTAEDWRPDYASFKTEDKGACLPRWVGERYIDVRKQGIFDVIKARIKLAKEKGCDAIDPDNIDVFSANGGGFRPRISKRDTVAYFRRLAREAAAQGISTGLKNAQSMLEDVWADIQFAVNEECSSERDCNIYRNFLSPRRTSGRNGRGGTQRIGKPVFHIEYTAESMAGGPVRREIDTENDNAAPATRRQCLARNRLGDLFSTTIKKVNLDGWVEYCDGYVAETQLEKGLVIKGLANECKGNGGQSKEVTTEVFNITKS
ncbi:hypothetical protein EJ08DRAFT_663608 [Tothia fuscella]|uniref:alpha-galactosidase n=1 Tax=Tothia fuscella TaxID=1048955 RepID=A0A9P4NKR4_9PEZI|nr:hypothetical protein EJ08DRAFT_663608 [Tothia fuscella]